MKCDDTKRGSCSGKCGLRGESEVQEEIDERTLNDAHIVTKLYVDTRRRQDELVSRVERAEARIVEIEAEKERNAADRIAAISRAEKAEAEASVRGGEWCVGNGYAGSDGYGACARCCRRAVEIAEGLKRAAIDLANAARELLGVPWDDTTRRLEAENAIQEALERFDAKDAVANERSSREAR